MNAVKFPEMISLNQTQIVKDLDATKQNLGCLLHSHKRTLLGDPNFGINLRKLIYESNNDILRDLVVDDLYVAIKSFMPQIKVLRQDIEVNSVGNSVVVSIRAQNRLDFSFASYNLELFNMEDYNNVV